MAKERALNKAKKEYYKKRAKFQTPGWILGIIGLVSLISGILLKIKLFSATGIFLLAVGIYFIIMGGFAHQMLFRK